MSSGGILVFCCKAWSRFSSYRFPLLESNMHTGHLGTGCRQQLRFSPSPSTPVAPCRASPTIRAATSIFCLFCFICAQILLRLRPHAVKIGKRAAAPRTAVTASSARTTCVWVSGDLLKKIELWFCLPAATSVRFRKRL